MKPARPCRSEPTRFPDSHPLGGAPGSLTHIPLGERLWKTSPARFPGGLQEGRGFFSNLKNRGAVATFAARLEESALPPGKNKQKDDSGAPDRSNSKAVVYIGQPTSPLHLLVASTPERCQFPGGDTSRWWEGMGTAGEPFLPVPFETQR